MVWDILVPAMETGSLLPAISEQNQLQQDLKELKYIPPQMKTVSAIAAKISGKEFLLDKNMFNAKSVSFMFAPS